MLPGCLTRLALSHAGIDCVTGDGTRIDPHTHVLYQECTPQHPQAHAHPTNVQCGLHVYLAGCGRWRRLHTVHDQGWMHLEQYYVLRCTVCDFWDCRACGCVLHRMSCVRGCVYMGYCASAQYAQCTVCAARQTAGLLIASAHKATSCVNSPQQCRHEIRCEGEGRCFCLCAWIQSVMSHKLHAGCSSRTVCVYSDMRHHDGLLSLETCIEHVH